MRAVEEALERMADEIRKDERRIDKIREFLNEADPRTIRLLKACLKALPLQDLHDDEGFEDRSGGIVRTAPPPLKATPKQAALALRRIFDKMGIRGYQINLPMAYERLLADGFPFRGPDESANKNLIRRAFRRLIDEGCLEVDKPSTGSRPALYMILRDQDGNLSGSKDSVDLSHPPSHRVAAP